MMAKIVDFAVLVVIIIFLSFCCAELNITTTNPLSGLAIECTFDPPEIIDLYEGDTVPVYLDCSTRSTHPHVLLLRGRRAGPTITAVSVDPSIADVFHEEDRFNQTVERLNGSVFFVQGLFLGRTLVRVSVQPFNETSPSSPAQELQGSEDGDVYHVESFVDYRVAVIRRERAIDHIFLGLVAILVVCASVGIGCKVDLAVVKEVLMRPVAPAIGFSCQYIIMPLTAFALVKLLGLSGGQALGFFTAGCAPGGGSSNMYTYLLGGDVTLSVTLTLISILASLFMIPLWLFTLGQLLIASNASMRIPFQNIIISLVSILVPVAIGILIQKKWTKGAKFIVRCLRPFYILLILCMFTIGVYSNLYIFRLITPTLILAGCLLPYTGFLLSGVVAFILRQPLPRILTIAIETGIQNTGLPIILMKFSLPQPDADLSVVSPVVIAMFMPLPLWIAVGIVEIRKRCCKKRGKMSLEPDVAIDNTVQTNLEETVGEKLVQGGNNNCVKSDTSFNGKNDMVANAIPLSKPL